VVAAVAIGGFLGALGRYELGLTWPSPPGHFPWTTFAINISGSFLLGLVLALLLERGGPRLAQPFFCVGVLGAWTTMSTFAVEEDLLIKGGHAGTAAAYLLATLVVGVSATWIGVALARAFDPVRLR